jgi:hypothetical protein
MPPAARRAQICRYFAMGQVVFEPTTLDQESPALPAELARQRARRGGSLPQESRRRLVVAEGRRRPPRIRRPSRAPALARRGLGRAGRGGSSRVRGRRGRARRRRRHGLTKPGRATHFNTARYRTHRPRRRCRTAPGTARWSRSHLAERVAIHRDVGLTGTTYCARGGREGQADGEVADTWAEALWPPPRSRSPWPSVQAPLRWRRARSQSRSSPQPRSPCGQAQSRSGQAQ